MLPLTSDAMADLTRAFAADLPAAWRRARDRHPGQTPYAFVLHGSEGGERPHVWPVVLTEEALTRVAQDYLDKGYHDTLDEARDALRWAVPDAPDCYEWADGGLPTVDAAVEQHIGTDIGDGVGYRWLADAAVPAWRKLDAAGVFGTGRDRGRLLLGFMLFDVAEDDTLGTIPLLNPPAVVKRFRRATEPTGYFQSVGDLTVSADGRWIYTVGTTKDMAAPADDDDDDDDDQNVAIYEVVAYAAGADRAPMRRWWHRVRAGLGDALLSVAIDPSDGSLVVLRQRRDKGMNRATLTRFAADAPDPVHAADFAGEANGRTLAVSADGSRVLVAGDAGTLWVFDPAVLPPGPAAVRRGGHGRRAASGRPHARRHAARRAAPIRSVDRRDDDPSRGRRGRPGRVGRRGDGRHHGPTVGDVRRVFGGRVPEGRDAGDRAADGRPVGRGNDHPAGADAGGREVIA